ncbi:MULTISPECIES: hypothetical protein [unclassified Sporosarcina]|uniref:hypothetical protein n=1 Tax=unclassified Sporosarcina TaxID=2647733 RepID=UPI00203DF467|nr:MULTISPECIES: hypothetical protein [unclassified Sporosarcina]GKV63917.1 hypothetical protein NCCP2331_00700 [Sporosarcina sp. NCCP-2331]GLB54697.1 hypothetical protein NCCP2378_04820 [Sporosarcina sp. NCCP-2378]
MKNQILYILVGILLVSQAVSFFKINNLQMHIENTTAEMEHWNNSVRNDMNMISSNVDDMLKQKASLIESAATELGAINAEELTLPLTFTLTPKEVSQHTVVSLDFDGELFPMQKSGTTFRITVSRDIFGDALPKIVINERGVMKTTQDDRIGMESIKEVVFPTLIPSFEGEERYNDNIYWKKGILSADIQKVESEIKFTDIRVVSKVDDHVISDKKIPHDMFSEGYETDEEVTLGDGEIYTTTIIATNNIGFEHHYIVNRWIQGTEPPGEPIEHEQIYSADGKLLWDSRVE